MSNPPHYEDTMHLVHGIMEVLEEEDNAGICFNAVGTSLIHFLVTVLAGLEKPKDRDAIRSGIKSLSATLVQIADSDDPEATANEFAMLSASGSSLRH